jgi:hypothetical protein
MKFTSLHEGSALFLYLILVTNCFDCTKAVAQQTIDDLYQNMEGYYVDMKDDTSFVTLKIPIYLEEPDYVLLQYKVKYFDQAGEEQKLKAKSTKSFGFAFHNMLIRMVAFKKDLSADEFLRLLDDQYSKLPDESFKLFVRYTLPNPMISTITKEPMTKQYFYQQGNSKLTLINNAHGLKKLNKYLLEKEEK